MKIKTKVLDNIIVKTSIDDESVNHLQSVLTYSDLTPINKYSIRAR